MRGIDRGKIAERAYEIWKRKGCPQGREVENWLEAEAELMAKGPDHPAVAAAQRAAMKSGSVAQKTAIPAAPTKPAAQAIPGKPAVQAAGAKPAAQAGPAKPAAQAIPAKSAGQASPTERRAGRKKR